MDILEQKIRERFLSRLDSNHWDDQDPRLDFGSPALPYFVAAFEQERHSEFRARLISIIWQFRDRAAVPTLARAICDDDPEVWKEALDGLVTLGDSNTITLLKNARNAVANNRDCMERSAWIDEAIDQIQAQLSARLDQFEAH